MATSRRNFLKTGAMGLICAGVPAALSKAVIGNPAGVGKSPEGNAKSQINFTKETFAPYLNTTFRIRSKSTTLAFKLSEITDLKAAKQPAQIAAKESFSLLFQGSQRAPHLTQDTYVVEHAALGKFSMFLVPIGKSANRHLEAVIVRL